MARSLQAPYIRFLQQAPLDLSGACTIRISLCSGLRIGLIGATFLYQDTSQCKVKDYLCIVSTPAVLSAILSSSAGLWVTLHVESRSHPWLHSLSPGRTYHRLGTQIASTPLQEGHTNLILVNESTYIGQPSDLYSFTSPSSARPTKYPYNSLKYSPLPPSTPLLHFSRPILLKKQECSPTDGRLQIPARSSVGAVGYEPLTSTVAQGVSI